MAAWAAVVKKGLTKAGKVVGEKALSKATELTKRFQWRPFVLPLLTMIVLLPTLVIFFFVQVLYNQFVNEAEASGTSGTSTVMGTKGISDKVLMWKDEMMTAMAKPKPECAGQADCGPMFTPDEIQMLIPYILALTMAESGGDVPNGDIMQSSESMCNGQMGCITDPITSIKYGIEHFYKVWKKVKDKAEATKNTQVNTFDNIIKLTLQSYNMGGGFTDYAFANGAIFSEKMAADFSDKMVAKLGWSTSCSWRSPHCYGNHKYVEKVFEFLDFSTQPGGQQVVQDGDLPTLKSAKSNFSDESQSVVDPTGTGGRVTPRLAAMYKGVKDNNLFHNDVSCWGDRTWGEHPKGRACDFMFRFGENSNSSSELAEAEKMITYLLQNQEKFGIYYIIWQNKIWSTKDPTRWRPYEFKNDSTDCTKPGSGQQYNTLCHNDHVHVSVY